MKKLFYFIGAAVTAASVFAAIAIMLKRLKISLSIESVDDEDLEEELGEEVTVTVQDEETPEEDDSDIASEIEIELQNLESEE